MEQPVRHEPASADGEVPAEDVRAGRPYLLAPASLRSLARRVVSTLVLATIDVAGLVIGLYLALALRAFVVDPHPVLWGLLWNEETNWLAFLILLLVLVFWRARLYGPREVREGAARVVPGVFLVAALALAFAIGTGQHFTTFGLYVTGGRVRLGADRALPGELRGADRGAAALARRPPPRRARRGRRYARPSAQHARVESRRHRLRVRRRGRARAGGRSGAGARPGRRADRLRPDDLGRRAARARRPRPAARREGSRRAPHDGAARRARRVRARPGGAAVRAAAADLRRHALGDEARVRRRRRRSDRRSSGCPSGC